MKKKKFITTAIITGVAAAVGAVIYKKEKETRNFTEEKWNEDVSKRYKMADSLIRSERLIGASRQEIIALLGINGLRSNTEESIEYYLSLDTESPKLLILEFNEEDKVANCAVCM